MTEQTTDTGPGGSSDADPLLTVTLASNYLQFTSPGAFRVSLARKTHPTLNAAALYIGRRVYFKRSSLDQFIADSTAAGKARTDK